MTKLDLIDTTIQPDPFKPQAGDVYEFGHPFTQRLVVEDAPSVGDFRVRFRIDGGDSSLTSVRAFHLLLAGLGGLRGLGRVRLEEAHIDDNTDPGCNVPGHDPALCGHCREPVSAVPTGRWSYYSRTPTDLSEACTLQFHSTPEMAKREAAGVLEDGSDGWPEDVASVGWGMLVPLERAVEHSRRETPGEEFDWTCEYKLAPEKFDGLAVSTHVIEYWMDREQAAERALASRAIQRSASDVTEEQLCANAVAYSMSSYDVGHALWLCGFHPGDDPCAVFSLAAKRAAEWQEIEEMTRQIAMAGPGAAIKVPEVVSSLLSESKQVRAELLTSLGCENSSLTTPNLMKTALSVLRTSLDRRVGEIGRMHEALGVSLRGRFEDLVTRAESLRALRQHVVTALGLEAASDEAIRRQIDERMDHLEEAVDCARREVVWCPRNAVLGSPSKSADRPARERLTWVGRYNNGMGGASITLDGRTVLVSGDMARELSEALYRHGHVIKALQDGRDQAAAREADLCREVELLKQRVATYEDDFAALLAAGWTSGHPVKWAHDKFAELTKERDEARAYGTGLESALAEVRGEIAMLRDRDEVARLDRTTKAAWMQSSPLDCLDGSPDIRCWPATGIVIPGGAGPILTIMPEDGGDVAIVHMEDVAAWLQAYKESAIGTALPESNPPATVPDHLWAVERFGDDAPVGYNVDGTVMAKTNVADLAVTVLAVKSRIVVLKQKWTSDDPAFDAASVSLQDDDPRFSSGMGFGARKGTWIWSGTMSGTMEWMGEWTETSVLAAGVIPDLGRKDRIRVDGVATEHIHCLVGEPLMLSNADDAGVTSWRWSVVAPQTSDPKRRWSWGKPHFSFTTDVLGDYTVHLHVVREGSEQELTLTVRAS